MCVSAGSSWLRLPPRVQEPHRRWHRRWQHRFAEERARPLKALSRCVAAVGTVGMAHGAFIGRASSLRFMLKAHVCDC